MKKGKTIFGQLLSFLPGRQLRRIVKKYRGNYRVRTFSCWDQYICMMFAQLTYRESLRDIETCLRTMQKKIYHVGIKGKVSRSTLADANDSRNWRIYRDFALTLIKQARRLYINEPFGLELKQTVYALDASVILLCLSVFPWAKYSDTKAGIKLHTQIDLRGNIPVFIDITHAKLGDVDILDKLVIEAGALYIMDRGYIDFARLHRFTTSLAFFIIRARKSLSCRRLYSNRVDKNTNVRSDTIVVLRNNGSRRGYPQKLRRIRYFDDKHKRYLIFLTNNFSLSAQVIADLYVCRWQIELFFKWIKQHLRIKAFYGTSENAIHTQIWIAISVYVLVAIVKKRLKIDLSLYTILQILSVSLFEKIPISQAFSGHSPMEDMVSTGNQLDLFRS